MVGDELEEQATIKGQGFTVDELVELFGQRVNGLNRLVFRVFKEPTFTRPYNGGSIHYSDLSSILRTDGFYQFAYNSTNECAELEGGVPITRHTLRFKYNQRSGRYICISEAEEEIPKSVGGSQNPV